MGIPVLRAVALYPPLMDTLRALIGEEMLFHPALTGWVSINHRPDIVGVERDENGRAYAAFEVPPDID